MKKLFATAFLLGTISALPAIALDLSSIGQNNKPAGNSVMFQDSAETEEQNQSSVVKQEETPAIQPSKAAAAQPKPKNIFSGAVRIVAVVNGEIITTEDLQNRINAFIMNTRIPVNEQTQNMIVQRTLQAAIDEKLKLQDAEKMALSSPTKS